MTNEGRYQQARRAWRTLYAPMQQGFFVPTGVNETAEAKAAQPVWPDDASAPFPDPVAIAPGRFVLRGLIVDMTDILAFAQAQPDWSEIEIIADVILFPTHVHDDRFDEFSFGLGMDRPTGGDTGGTQILRLIARSIETMDGVGVFTSYSRDIRLELFARTCTGNLVIGFDDEAFGSFHPMPLADGAAGVVYDGASGQLSPASQLPSHTLASGSALYWLMESVFNVGSVLAHDRRVLDADPANPVLSPPRKLSERQVLAADMLHWIAETAGNGPDAACQQLSLSAANLAGIVEGLATDMPYVPPLAKSLYDGLIRDLQGAAADYEAQFDRASTSLLELDSAEAFVAATQQNVADRAAIGQRLVAEAQKTVDDATTLLDQNTNQVDGLTRINGTLDKALLAFQSGAADYEREKKSEATLAIATASLEIGASLGAMAAGDEAGAAGAVESAEGVEKAAEEVSKIKKLIETIKKIAEMVSKLKAVVDALKTAKDAVDNYRAIAPKAAELGKGISRPGAGTDGVLDAAYWDVFRLGVEDILSPLVGEIDGADKYLSALRQLSIYGKAVTANRMALIAAQQNLLKLTLDTEVEDRMEQRLTTIVATDKDRIASLRSARALLYQDLLRVKGRVLIYMDALTSAYRYWAVEPDIPIDCVPYLSDSVASLREKLARLSELGVQKMAAFDPTPEPMQVTLVLDDADFIARLRRDRRASITISPDNPAFLLRDDPAPGQEPGRFERVRLLGERVYLNPEAVPDRDMVVKLTLRTNGHYTDSFRGAGPFEYMATDAAHVFEYTQGKDAPIADARPADGLAVFHPTPFTTWTIDILNAADALDLDRLTRLELTLFGNWSPSLPDQQMGG